MRKKCNLILSIDIMKYKNDNPQIFYHCCCSWNYLLNTKFFIVDSKWKFQEKYFGEAHSFHLNKNGEFLKYVSTAVAEISLIQKIHQMFSPISKFESTIFLTNICYDFLFSNTQIKKNLWKKFFKQIGENVWWILSPA